MITAKISAYLLFKQLPELKTITRKGITTERKQPRFDLVAITGYWQPLERLKNYKGVIYLTLIKSDQIEAREKGTTTPEYYLQITPAKSKSINFSGLRFLFSDGKASFASGEPSDSQKLKGGVINPMYEQRNDGFLFFFPDRETMEILVIDGGRLLIDSYRKQLSIGGFDEALRTLREQAKPLQ
jgi:hypothetical protein